MSTSTIRRPKGRGTRRADGRWMVRYSAPDEDGQPRRQVLYAPSQKELQEKLVAALQGRNVGEVLARQGRAPILKRHLEDWLAGMEGRLQPRTIKRYREIVDLHLVPTLGSVPLKKLQPAQVDRMLAAKHREGLSRRTRTYIRTSLGAAMELALKRGLVGRNVVRLTEPLAQRAAESVDRDWVAYTPEQARNLLEAGREDIDWPLWALALTTGARMGELLGLKWSDVDWERRELRIVRALERIGSSYRLKENKTPKSRRTVPLAAVAIEALKQQKAKQAAARLEAAEWSDAWGLVFTKASGAPRLDTAVHRHFQRRLQAYGLPVIRFHDLRHTHATQLLNAGIPVHEVSRRLGHASPTITLAVYAHAQPSMAAAITSAIDRLLT